jgi:DNA-binding helix-hairpin-helix protein with protein kinase domain
MTASATAPLAGYRRARNRPLTLGPLVGRGGEANVYTVGTTRRWVAKLYHDPTPARADKLRQMIANPPADPARAQGHTAIAWPVELVTSPTGQVAGFLMPAVDARISVPSFKLYNPRDRLATWPGFGWDYLLRAAANLAGVVRALHARGYVIGDLNESNILITNTALVTLVDCDSMQVPAGGAEVFRCTVGKVEYTPPELQGRDFTTLTRTPEHDAFGLAVLIHLFLMEGIHPYQGVWRGSGAPTIAEHIRAGRCALIPGSGLAPAPYALPMETLPPELRALMLRCFGDGHRNPAARPSAAEWQRALGDASRKLGRCSANKRHVYAKHLSVCPWCARSARGLPDPFPPVPEPAPVPRARKAAPAARRRTASSTGARGHGSARRSSKRKAQQPVWVRVLGMLAVFGSGSPQAPARRARGR